MAQNSTMINQSDKSWLVKKYYIINYHISGRILTGIKHNRKEINGIKSILGFVHRRPACQARPPHSAWQEGGP